MTPTKSYFRWFIKIFGLWNYVTSILRCSLLLLARLYLYNTPNHCKFSSDFIETSMEENVQFYMKAPIIDSLQCRKFQISPAFDVELRVLHRLWMIFSKIDKLLISLISITWFPRTTSFVMSIWVLLMLIYKLSYLGITSLWRSLGSCDLCQLAGVGWQCPPDRKWPSQSTHLVCFLLFMQRMWLGSFLLFIHRYPQSVP